MILKRPKGTGSSNRLEAIVPPTVLKIRLQGSRAYEGKSEWRKESRAIPDTCRQKFCFAFRLRPVLNASRLRVPDSCSWD